MEKGATIATDHTDMIHDLKPDYYGKYVASCSSDKTIKIYEVIQDKFELVTELTDHQGPVWQICWAHPKYGALLASCSYDRKIIIWKQHSKNQWSAIYTYESHEYSVNSIDFAPHELGLILAAGSSDGTVSIHIYREGGKWDSFRTPTHTRGVNTVSWAPSMGPGALLSGSPVLTAKPRLATGGCDNVIKIWRFDEQSGVLKQEDEELHAHSDWIRDVAWAPSVCSRNYVLASASQDGKVIIWSQGQPGERWKQTNIPKEDHDVVWRVNWSITGNILAVSSGDGNVTLWKEGTEDEWKCISKIDETTDK